MGILLCAWSLFEIFEMLSRSIIYYDMKYLCKEWTNAFAFIILCCKFDRPMTSLHRQVHIWPAIQERLYEPNITANQRRSCDKKRVKSICCFATPWYCTSMQLRKLTSEKASVWIWSCPPTPPNVLPTAVNNKCARRSLCRWLRWTVNFLIF